ncbi:hypothetical protein LXL04_002724 [Taraxacum kok-saghyz]
MSQWVPKPWKMRPPPTIDTTNNSSGAEVHKDNFKSLAYITDIFACEDFHEGYIDYIGSLWFLISTNSKEEVKKLSNSLNDHWKNKIRYLETEVLNFTNTPKNPSLINNAENKEIEVENIDDGLISDESEEASHSPEFQSESEDEDSYSGRISKEELNEEVVHITVTMRG